MNQEILKSTLAELNLPGLRYFDVIGSSNDEALQWIKAGAKEGCLVVADKQTQGRGRLGRRWITQPGSALAFSLILTPAPDEYDRFGLFSPLGAVAICQALEEGWGLKPEIKWPNDVLLAGRKASGILVEASWSGSQLEGLVIGIGLNVTSASTPPDDQVLYPATSLEQALGKPVERVQVLLRILSSLLAWRSKIQSDAFFKVWEARLAFKNQWVLLDPDAQQADGTASIRGKVTGLDSSGNLLLQLATGEIKAVAVGDVHLRPIQSN